MSQKMLSCICGNTDLEKVEVNLLRTNASEAMELIALVCRGNGCGRVTFRPTEGPAAETRPSETRPAEMHPPEARIPETRSPELRSTELHNNGTTKSKPEAADHSRETMKQLIALFEQVYTERLVYKVIAERDAGCSALVQALKADREIRDGITRTFMPIYQSVERNQDFIKLLESLPSTGSKQPNGGAVAALAASK